MSRDSWFELDPPSEQPDGWSWSGESGSWYIAGVVEDAGKAYVEPDPDRVSENLDSYEALSIAWVPNNGGVSAAFYTHVHGPIMDLEQLGDMIYDDIMDIYG